jgi:hypothetical protein
MVQQLGKVILRSDQNHPSVLNLKEIKEIVIKYLFRYESLVDEKDQLIDMNSIIIGRIERETVATKMQVIRIYGRLLYQIRGLTFILGSNLVKWAHTKTRQYRKVRIYLHRIHRIAPVFDYTRALHNLKVLHTLFSRYCCWPTISTQLALLIFVTDRNDPHRIDSNTIIQKNLRVLCSCSGYAFHRARNKLGIDKEGKVTPSKEIE